uniref:AAA ATPase AAA+ lid domain-containing protein n=1 Tax=Nelumbo nucifera TaxID=4432 RepID=A0A822YRY3_NELNU|nr:TPA_asm: hypothetical protein HUJ06_006052 [Nelumbo nucifera]
MRSIGFKVIETDLAEYCVVTPDTDIFCEGELVRKDEDGLDELSYDEVSGVRKQIAQIQELVELPLRHTTFVWLPKGILLICLSAVIFSYCYNSSVKVDLERIAKDTCKYVSADLAALCTEVALKCIREKMDALD